MSIQSTTHNRTFRQVYSRPKIDNVISRIPISTSFQSTRTAIKHLTLAVLQLPFFEMNVMRAAASLRCVSRRDKENWNTSPDSLVSNKHPELIERPIIGSSSLGWAARLGVEKLANIAQILKRTYGFSFIHQLSADAVINVLSELRLFPRKPLEEGAIWGLGAYKIQISFDSLIHYTSSISVFVHKSLSVSAPPGDVD